MNGKEFDMIARSATAGSLTRRVLAQGLAGLAVVAGISSLDLEDAEAKKRKRKGKNKKRKKKGKGGGNDGGGGGECNQTICEGQCVNLDTDEQNCGACGKACLNGSTCAGGLCVTVIGEQGSALGQFDEPTGIAFRNAGGEILIVDSSNARVQLLQDGESLDEFGTPGEEDGQFLQASGVAVNGGTGDIYVTDVERHCIQRFSTLGDFEETFGFFGSGREQLNFPSGVAIDQQTGNVYVTDTGNNQLKELNANLFALGEIRLVDGPGRFANPRGIAVDGDRNLVVADTGNDRIVITDRDGNFIRAFGQAGSGNGEFDSPVAVAVTRDGNIFVVDQGNNRVQIFSSDGQFVKAVGRGGNGVGEFDAPTGILAVSLDLFTVVDTGNNRLQEFLSGGSAP